MPLFLNYKERGLFLLLLLIIFAFSTSLLYQDFLDLKKREVHFSSGEVLKQYQKSRNGKYWVLKVKLDSGIEFYTSSREDLKRIQGRRITIGFLSKNIEFLDLFQGFYATSIYVALHTKEPSLKDKLREYIYKQHTDKDLKEFFGAIFLGEGVGKDLRDKITNLGIAHLIALSGYHLGILFTIIAFIFLPIYKLFHGYYPYRNKLRDLFWFSFVFVTAYLYLVGFIPSLIRAFAMAVFGYFLGSRNLKILSFENLLWVSLVLIALFPKLLFSIGFFFSLGGVFYIFMFVKFVEIKNKLLYSILLSIFLFVVMTPVVFYFFNNASLYQFLSPVITLFFSLFFPLEIFFHVINLGWVLDSILLKLLSLELAFFKVEISSLLFFSYLGSSLLAIRGEKSFYLFSLFSFSIFTFTYI